MRRIQCALLAAVAGIGFASITRAADMPVKAPLTPVAAPAPVNSWTGFYIGANIGGGWMNAPTYTFADPGNAANTSCGPCKNAYSSPALSGSSASGWLGGIHLGYNWQFAPMWLTGVEGDFTWTHIDQSVNGPLNSLPIVPSVPGSNLNFETDARWLASFRGRVGFVQNNWLIYATGGVAWADLHFAANASCLPPAVAGGCGFGGGFTQSPFSQSTTTFGFVVGGGLEWQMPASQWRARLEYLYYGFDRTDSRSSLFVAIPAGGPLVCINTPTCSANYTFGNVNLQTLRLGLSYAFR